MQKIQLTENFATIQEAAVAGLNQYLGRRPTSDRIFLNRRSVCVKALPVTSIYPEIKERLSAKKADIYVLATVDLKTKQVYLEGWVKAETLLQDKNFSTDSETYYVSYKDVDPIETLCQ